MKQAGVSSILVVVTLLAAGVIAEAQPAGKAFRIGYLTSFGPPNDYQINAFRQGLRELGYIEGKNVAIEYRFPDGNTKRSTELATELVQLKVDVIVALELSAIRAAKQATQTIPIVFITNQDPVETHIVDGLARPGGNATGLTRMSRELGGKLLELLKEAVPSLKRVGVLWVRPTELATGAPTLQYIEPAASALKIQLQSLVVERPTPDLQGAFRDAVKGHVNALMIVGNAVLTSHLKKIGELTIKNRLPSITDTVGYVESGTLMSYSSDSSESHKRLAAYVDKVLKGTKPMDIPVERPMRFEFVVNLKTAKEIGFPVPPNLLVRATRVIR